MMHEYTKEPMSRARCPECGDEEKVVRQVATDGGPPVPAGSAGECMVCGHRDDPLAFATEYRKARLDEEEKRRRREQRDRLEFQIAGWEASAKRLSQLRTR